MFEDTYYDRDDVLSKQGVYVRRRRYLDTDKDHVNVNMNAKTAEGQLEKLERSSKSPKSDKIKTSEDWEAKIRVAGNFTHSAFQELHGFDAVARVVREHFPHIHHHHKQRLHQQHQHALTPTTSEVDDGEGKQDKLGFRNLEVLARFITHRRQWLINERFHVVLDEADFGHMVGEVELAQSSTRVSSAASSECAYESLSQAGNGKQEKIGKEVAAQLDAEIEDFMERYAWAFPRGQHSQVQGKLSVYFAWKKRVEGEGGI